jgi:tetraprenyl-beta-curcumene synthase
VAGYRSRVALANAFSVAATRYWLGIFPQVKRELAHWYRQALRIPDPTLRHHALTTLLAERGNLDGAGAFAVLAPREYREQVVRASVAFQVAYEYADSLAEQPSANPTANGYQLHLALLAALDPARDHVDYYRYSLATHDGGYLENLADTCRGALLELPSYDAVLDHALRAVERMIVYQSLNHGGHTPPVATHMLASWAASVTPAHTDLRWWETAASTASSLGVLSLFASAGQPSLPPGETRAVAVAYFPWIGALNQLLDSLIDRAADHEAGHHSLIDHYSSIEEAAMRLGQIATRAMQATESIPGSVQHAMILAAMSSYYLSAPTALSPNAGLVARHVMGAMGAMATPAMLVLRLRRAAGQRFR